MPKAAPTQVIVHRIELQETERRMMETLTAAYAVRNVSKGIFNLTSDVTTVVVLIIVYEWITGNEILDDAFMMIWASGTGIAEALANNWNNYRQTAEYQEDYNQRATSVVGGLRNLLDNIIGAFTGEYIPDFVNE